MDRGESTEDGKRLGEEMRDGRNGKLLERLGLREARQIGDWRRWKMGGRRRRESLGKGKLWSMDERTGVRLP